MVVARKAGIMDHPDKRLKKHRNPTPYLGGVAIFLAFAGAVMVVKLVHAGTPRGVVGIMAGATIVFLVGLVDDVRPFKPWTKLGFQVLAAIVPICFGVHIKFIDNPWGYIPLTIFWIVGITNAFNLLDVMDGLSSGIAMIAAACFWAISASTGRMNDAIMAASIAGACGGFLFYNRPSARIFMGDAGSLFLGFSLGAVAIGLGYSQKTELGVLAPLMILGVPIFETLFLMAIRWQAGKPVMHGSPDHIALRLRKMGFSTWQAVGMLWGAGLSLAALSLWVIRLNWERALLMAVAVVFLAFLAAVRLASVKMDS
jgi:UDP-GlcNAc:undecaprenyl-phosphate GlcNAc-1-phosphate transferase